MTSRLFTFGCSFTKYGWPTWADAIAHSHFTNYENWGKTGGGNQFIAARFAECHQRNKITKDDTVMIMWSSVTREDRYIDGRWFTPGDVFDALEGYDEYFLKNYCYESGFYIRDLAVMSLVKNTLENIGCEFYFMSIVDIDTPVTVEPNSRKIIDLYGDVLKIMYPSVHKMCNYDWFSNRTPQWQKYKWDGHPLPTEHIEYVHKVLPEKFHLKENTIEIFNSFEKKLIYFANIRNMFSYRRDSRTKEVDRELFKKDCEQLWLTHNLSTNFPKESF